MIHSNWHKTLVGAKPLRIWFDKVFGFNRVYGGTKYLVLFGPEKYDAIHNTIGYLIIQKSGITYVFTHNYEKIKIETYNFLTLKETLTLHNVIMYIKSVLNKNKKYLLLCHVVGKIFVSIGWKIWAKKFLIVLSC